MAIPPIKKAAVYAAVESMPIVQPWGSSQVKGLNTKPLIMDFSIPRMPAGKFLVQS